VLKREDKVPQNSFADHSVAAQAVPEAHLLLRMKAAVDWAEVEKALGKYYDSYEGRPSWPPAVMVRMMVLQQYADLSDREVAEQTGYNLLYRAFVGLGLEEGVPDDTTLVRFRLRLGEQGVRQVFELLLQRWQQVGLVGAERRVLDASHLWAKVARRSWVSLLRQGRSLVVEAVGELDAVRAEGLRQRYLSAAGQSEARGPEALEQERQQTRQLVAEVAECKAERVVERARLLQAMLAEGDRPVSFVDPDARWGHKGEDKRFCGYKTHQGMDPDSRLITSVEVVPGNANEAVRTDKLLGQEESRLNEGATVIGDALYANATTLQQVKASGGRACFGGLHAERISDQFGYEAQADRMRCAEGKASIGKVRVSQGDLYYFSMSDCRCCPRSRQCLTPGEREGKAMARRRVYLSDVRKHRVLEGEAGKAWRKQQYRVRYRIEAKFDEQMNRHGLRRARYWGLGRVTVQVLWNVITVNLKRAARLLGMQELPASIVATA
jgi:IS5 family transposase